MSTKTIETRKAREKASLLDHLRKMPIVQIACERAGVARATYYRWRNEDADFTAGADKAIAEGVALVGDMAESQLISLMKERNLTANIFWLKHRHAAYKTRVEISGKVETASEKLSPEQEALVQQALKLAGIPETPNPKQP